MHSAERNNVRGTESVDRVARVLLAFVDAGSGLGVTEISRTVGLSKSVVHRMLQSLVARGLVMPARDQRRYELGPAAAAMGASALNRLELRQAARPTLWQLRDDSAETSTLSALVDTSRVYLDQVESPQEIKMTVEIGRRWPLHAGSTGKVLLAFVDEALRERVLSEPMAPLTERTTTDARRLREELDEIRSVGYSMSFGERQQGAASTAAPIFGWQGAVVGAISVCGPADRFTKPAMAEQGKLVAIAAAEITQRIIECTLQAPVR